MRKRKLLTAILAFLATHFWSSPIIMTTTEITRPEEQVGDTKTPGECLQTVINRFRDGQMAPDIFFDRLQAYEEMHPELLAEVNSARKQAKRILESLQLLDPDLAIEQILQMAREGSVLILAARGELIRRIESLLVTGEEESDKVQELQAACTLLNRMLDAVADAR